MSHSISARAFATAFASIAASAAIAQAEDKTAAVEAVPVAPAFTQWVVATVTAPVSAPTATVQVLPWAVPTGVGAAAPFEPWPVVLGAPELPLLGQGLAQAGRTWATGFNYQGMNVRLLVLDAAGRNVEVRPLSAPPRPGERFKFRVTTTFEAVSEVGLLVGEAFRSQRAGQLYPASGQSVHMRAGETVDLPLEHSQFLVMSGTPTERLLLSVRHVQAREANRSQQPAYRMDGRDGSSFLQLAPPASLPAFEQVVATVR